MKPFETLRKDPNSWYNKPAMMGHHWAKEMVDALGEVITQHGRSEKQKFLIANAIQSNSTDWHYFTNVGKAELGRIKHVLKHIDREPVLNVYNWYSQRSGMWRSELDKALNVLAHHENPKALLKQSSEAYKFYGMDTKAAEARAKRMVESFASKLAQPLVVQHTAKAWQRGPRQGLFVKTSSGKKEYKQKGS